MKKLSLLALASIATCHSAVATIFFSDNFDGYANANLVGQGPWAQTGATATSPVQVSASGNVVLGPTGQDVYAPLITPLPVNGSPSFYIGVDVTLTAAQATGDYFLHWTPTVGDSSLFLERLYAKSSGSGFVLGYGSGTVATPAYGSTVLSLNQDYRLVLEYTPVAGTLNDTFTLYVNPSDTSVEGNNTPYMTSGWNGTTAEQTTVAGINFRQGTAANAPSVVADNLDVANTFGEAAVFTVPEPSSVALGIAGGLAGLVIWKRRK